MLYFILILILLSALSLIEAIDARLIPKGTEWFVFFVLFLFAALRPVGADNDSEMYTFIFSMVSQPADYFQQWFLWGSMEPFYYLLPSVFNNVLHFPNYVDIIFYLFAFLGCGVVMIALRKLTPFYYAAILTLFCNLFLLQEMTQIRSAVATGFFLLCIRFRQQRDYGKFVACILFSTLFHYSSILGLFLLFFSDTKINRPVCAALTVLAFFLSFLSFNWVLGGLSFGAGALEGKQDAYVNDIKNELLNRRNYIVIIHTVSTLLLIAYSKRLYAYNKYLYLMIKVQVLGLILYQLFSASPVLSARVADYFLAAHLVTFSTFFFLFRYKLWPALALCVLNTAILLTLIYRNQIFDMSYYSLFPVPAFRLFFYA